jgi:hypothetical protein
MPVDLNLASSVAVASSHDHCQEAPSVSLTEDGKSSANASATHYCCAAVAILNISPVFFASQRGDVYLHSDASTPASNIPESIYKPPRNYL